MKKKIALLLAALLIASAAAYGCAKKDTTDPDPDTDITTPSEDGKNDDNQDDSKVKPLTIKRTRPTTP